MFRAEAWIERVQVSTIFQEDFRTLEEAQNFIREDWLTRSGDAEFVRHGGYDIYQQTWERRPRPTMKISPTVIF